MQPHSMCGVALANYMWNKVDRTNLKSATIDVEYYLNGKYRLNKYDLSNIYESKDRKELKVYVMRGGGGISCQLTLSRNSTSEGSEITIAHSQNHISGLREVFKLYKNKVNQGMHYNSMKYKNFQAVSYHPDRTVLKLDSEVKNKQGYYVPRHYEIDIVSKSA